VREVFRTSSALRRADADAVIRIPVVQGERLRADRNRSVGTLEIRPGDVRIDVPAGSEIEVTFEIDSSNLVTVVADVPLIQEQFEAEIDLDNVRAPSPAVLAEILSDAERRLTAARDSADATGSADAEVRLARLDEEGTLTPRASRSALPGRTSAPPRPRRTGSATCMPSSTTSRTRRTGRHWFATCRTRWRMRVIWSNGRVNPGNARS